jgi:hypothetical protein
MIVEHHSDRPLVDNEYLKNHNVDAYKGNDKLSDDQKKKYLEGDEKAPEDVYYFDSTNGDTYQYDKESGDYAYTGYYDDQNNFHNAQDSDVDSQHGPKEGESYQDYSDEFDTTQPNGGESTTPENEPTDNS